MTKDQETRCHTIIHSSAAGAGVGNIVPIPGLGVAADISALTLMAISLATVFGGNLSKSEARRMAYDAIKDVVKKQPLRVIGKELSKLIPFIGSVAAPVVSIAILESAGWEMAKQLDRKFS